MYLLCSEEVHCALKQTDVKIPSTFILQPYLSLSSFLDLPSEYFGFPWDILVNLDLKHA